MHVSSIGFLEHVRTLVVWRPSYSIYVQNLMVYTCTHVDATRVLLLDESHAPTLSASVTKLLRDLSEADAAKTFPVSYAVVYLHTGVLYICTCVFYTCVLYCPLCVH